MTTVTKQPKIGFITCADLSRFFPSKTEPLFTHDDQIAADALRKMGIAVEPVVWGTPIAELKQQNFSLFVIRSPWDYADSAENRANFFDWLAALGQTSVPLENPLATVLWNLDKHYLKDLEKKGVAIVPTDILKAGAAFDFTAHVKGHGAFVVKPCVSAGARDTFWIKSVEEAEAFKKTFSDLRLDRDFLLQPFIEEILTDGEWSLTFFGGEFAHAVLKLPKAGGWYVQDELGGTTQTGDAPPGVINLAYKAISALDKAPLYARVDIIPRRSQPLLGELELVEPELFFLQRTKNRTKDQGLPHHRSIELFCKSVKDKLRSMI
jgi:glutathione synthase/RimK-type ligase-like ATP-grasp enzyme